MLMGPSGIVAQTDISIRSSTQEIIILVPDALYRAPRCRWQGCGDRQLLREATDIPSHRRRSVGMDVGAALGHVFAQILKPRPAVAAPPPAAMATTANRSLMPNIFTPPPAATPGPASFALRKKPATSFGKAAPTTQPTPASCAASSPAWNKSSWSPPPT